MVILNVGLVEVWEVIILRITLQIDIWVHSLFVLLFM